MRSLWVSGGTEGSDREGRDEMALRRGRRRIVDILSQDSYRQLRARNLER